MLKFANSQHSGSFCQIYRVTDEALIAKTAVWPNFLLMNVFFVLKGSKLFIIIPLQNVQSNDLFFKVRIWNRVKTPGTKENI